MLPAIIATIFLAVVIITINVFNGTSVVGVVESIVAGRFNNFWYVSMLICVYIIVPILKKVKHSLTHKQYIRLSVTMMIWAVVSQATSSQRLAYSIGIVIAYVAYFLMGDVLKMAVDNGEIKKSIRNIMRLIILATICLAITYFCRRKGFNYYTHSWNTNFFSPTVVMYSIIVFVLFGFMTIDHDYSILASKTYYIYIFHSACLKIASRIMGQVNVPDLVKIIGSVAIGLIGAYIIGEIFRCLIEYMEKRGIKDRWYDMKIWSVLGLDG